MICPFCMEYHSDSVRECPDKKIKIPHTYIKARKERTPIIFMLTIGYSGHGKTCFLSSLLYTLYHGKFSKRWPHFTFLGLTQETLNRIHQEYVNILEQGKLPAKTPIMFPTPLILKLQNIPLKIRKFFRHKLEQRDVIFVFYDIGGGTFEVDEKIKENLPILEKINPLVFLIDLPGLIEDVQGTASAVVEKMQRLMNTVYLALPQIDQGNKKDIIVCFTKADLMWDKNEIYGPLATQLETDTPALDKTPGYIIAPECYLCISSFAA